jgi:3-oxoacyl-[acyl-carrier-protein] synthase II
MRRVVVTGMGVVSPVGIGREPFWDNLTGGRSGTSRVTLFDVSGFPVQIGAEVKGFDDEDVTARFPAAYGLRDRKVLLGLAAADEAVKSAALAREALGDAILVLGVGLESLLLEDLTPYSAHPDIAGAFASSALSRGNGPPLQTPLDRTGQILGDQLGLYGGRYTNCSACAAGAQAIGEAWQLLREGLADVALAGATDSMINPLGLGGFSLLRVLSTENESPGRACRPFDATREGTVLGEGAAFMILETLDHARARGAMPLSEVLGYGSSLDAFRVSDPDPTGQGAVRSMTRALKSADLTPDDIDCVSAHGTGTPKNDVVETNAIKDVTGRRAYDIPVHAVKSMTGHMIAASGAAEAVAAVMTISTNRIPPTINLCNRDPECDLDYVSEGARPFEGDTVLSNSFGFGGQNATLIFGRTG